MSEKIEQTTFLTALHTAFTKHISYIEKSHTQEDQYYWRVYDGLLFAVESLSSYLIQQYLVNQLRPFNLPYYLKTWTSSLYSVSNSMYRGRVLSTGGCFSQVLDIEDAATHVSLCVVNLRNTNHIVKLSCIRYSQFFSSTLFRTFILF